MFIFDLTQGTNEKSNFNIFYTNTTFQCFRHYFQVRSDGGVIDEIQVSLSS